MTICFRRGFVQGAEMVLIISEGESDMVDLMGNAQPNDFSHESFSL
jgi:hypothetical protein